MSEVQRVQTEERLPTPVLFRFVKPYTYLIWNDAGRYTLTVYRSFRVVNKFELEAEDVEFFRTAMDDVFPSDIWLFFVGRS